MCIYVFVCVYMCGSTYQYIISLSLSLSLSLSQLGFTPLLCAIQEAKLDVVKVLCENKADVNTSLLRVCVYVYAHITEREDSVVIGHIMILFSLSLSLSLFSSLFFFLFLSVCVSLVCDLTVSFRTCSHSHTHIHIHTHIHTHTHTYIHTYSQTTPLSS